MKLRLLSLLLLGVLLAGCTPQVTQPGVTTSPTAPTAQTVPTEPEEAEEVPEEVDQEAPPRKKRGGLIALLVVLLLLGRLDLLIPANLFAYQLVWMIPGVLITEWTRAI